MGALGTHESITADHKLGFFRRYIFSLDHKVIGVQYILTAMVMAIVGGLLSMLIRLQLAWPSHQWPWLGQVIPTGMEGGVMKPEFYLSLVTMHGTIMVFFLLTAVLAGGFGNFIIPLQIGARDMAFPFLNALSYWTFFLSCLAILSAFFVVGGAPLGGWTAYAPLSALPQTGPGQGMGMTMWIVAIGLFVFSSLFGALNYITTILNLRTKGMSMMRLPLTTWSLLITAILGLLAFPVLLGAAILLFFDRSGGTSFFIPGGLTVGEKLVSHAGGHPLLWQHLFWFFGHPEVYIVILPAMGIVSDILSTFSRKPIFSYKTMVLSMSSIGVLSFIVWGHHMFVSGMNPLLGSAFALTTLAIAVPSAIKTFNWLFTLWGARIRFTAAMLFSIGFVSLFVSGGLSGIFLGNSAVDIHLHDTYFVVAHFHLIMAVAPVFAMFAGLYYWFPKMFGRMMNETLGKLHFWGSLIGVYCVFFTMHVIGMAGHIRRTYDPYQYEFLKHLQPANIFITKAAFILGAVQLLFLINFWWSLFKGKKATDNPWRANSLEWTTSTPPPHGNWEGEIPTVCRWPYDYSAPGVKEDFALQSEPLPAAPSGK
ncbi:MAG: cbb3-type cytochrome c oxidase subunit I [Acidobacteria bacterium]|nr:cbb3-type cytochrome c oxidase subunit I [Acidobacteriota bacterium]MBI3656118.1 cbb3-type cytochrome c oxidase subunit I [Acidobacteriota bacterium]